MSILNTEQRKRLRAITPATTGEAIALYRKEAGLTQEQLAERLGVSQSTVTDWERDKTKPRLRAIEALAMAFGNNLAEILNRSEVSNRIQPGYAESEDEKFVGLRQDQKFDLLCLRLTGLEIVHDIKLDKPTFARVIYRTWEELFSPFQSIERLSLNAAEKVLKRILTDEAGRMGDPIENLPKNRF